VLLLSTGAGFALGFTGTESQPLVLLFWLVAYAVGGGLLIDTIVRLRRRPPVPPWLLLFVILAATSTFWSESPSVTLRRAFALAGPPWSAWPSPTGCGRSRCSRPSGGSSSSSHSRHCCCT
jgi:hypothetical protein